MRLVPQAAAQWILDQCHDFKSQKPAVYECIEGRGHECIFLPKFHPECNFIERYWCRCKQKSRSICDYSFKSLCEKVPDILRDHCTLSDIRKIARHAWRWMDAYRNGHTGRAADFVIKKFKGHRGIPAALDEELAATVAGFQL